MNRSSLVAFALPFTLAFAPFVACGSSDSNVNPSANGGGAAGQAGGGGQGGSGGALAATNCSARCQQKLDECNFDSLDQSTVCTPFCSASPSEAQLECVEGTSCAVLQARQSVCGGTSAGGSGGSASDGSTSGGDGSNVGQGGGSTLGPECAALATCCAMPSFPSGLVENCQAVAQQGNEDLCKQDISDLSSTESCTVKKPNP